MLRRIKQPAWVYRVERGWSGDVILDYRMSEAIQPHPIFSSPSQDGLCPLRHLHPSQPWFCDRTPFFCGPVTLFLPGVSPVTAISLLPTAYPNSKKEQGRAAGCGSGLRELWLQSSSDIDGASRFCKPLLLSGF